MKFQRDLQVKLQERYRRLYKSNSQAYPNEAAYLVDFIRSTPALLYLVQDLERSEPELDPETWVGEHIGWHRLEWPRTELGRAKVAWHLLGQWADGLQDAAMFGYSVNPSQNNLNVGVRTATET